MTEGFGFKDFGRALAHPFKFKISLVVGAIMFMIFTIAQSAASFGSFFLLGGAIISFMLANMLAFGVLANTIENFSQGKLGADFMPKFDDFNLWDDVVHPFFLAIGVYISSFGAFFLVIVIGILLIVNSVSSSPGQAENLKQQTVPPLMIDQQKTLSQSDEVKKLLENAQKEAIEKRALTEKGLSDLDSGQQLYGRRRVCRDRKYDSGKPQSPTRIGGRKNAGNPRKRIRRDDLEFYEDRHSDINSRVRNISLGRILYAGGVRGGGLHALIYGGGQSAGRH